MTVSGVSERGVGRDCGCCVVDLTVDSEGEERERGSTALVRGRCEGGIGGRGRESSDGERCRGTDAGVGAGVNVDSGANDDDNDDDVVLVAVDS